MLSTNNLKGLKKLDGILLLGHYIEFSKRYRLFLVSINFFDSHQDEKKFVIGRKFFASEVHTAKAISITRIFYLEGVKKCIAVRKSYCAWREFSNARSPCSMEGRYWEVVVEWAPSTKRRVGCRGRKDVVAGFTSVS